MSSIDCATDSLENDSHGMFRLLPWSSPGVGANKVMAEDLKMLVASKQRKSPILDGPAMQPKLKRKRGDSNDQAAVLTGHVVAKSRMGDYERAVPLPTDHQKPASARLPSNDSSDNPHATPTKQTQRSRSLTEHSATPRSDPPRVNGPTVAPTKMDIDQLRETLDAQLSLEVLLKHDELRLIEQEMAKCQVALEQLRRCAEIPYPGSNVMGISTSVSDGTGMAVQAEANGRRPPISPAPWGVTDGPYTRHYAKWLLPDPHFDGGEAHSGASLLSPTNYGSLDGRPTRASLGETGYVAGKSRSQRGSTNARLQALSSGYPPPKDKAGPMIIKRKNDGQLVKLICLDCRRDNFSSTQGFINHCRIAHNRNFASHDAAAMASGEPVEVNEAGMVVGGSSDSSNNTGVGYVHPLIRSAHMVESMSRANIQRRPSGDGQTVGRSSNNAGAESRSRPKKRRLSSPTTPTMSFKASSDTPHLSSLLERRGIRLDLQRIVGDAKITVDLAAYSSEEGSEDEAAGARIEPHLDRSQLSVHGGRQPTRTTMPQTASQRPTSRKGLEKANQKLRQLKTSVPTKTTPYTSPYAPPLAPAANTQLDGTRDIDMTVDGSENSSPHIMESNQAPSLVSDDDEYEAPSESESPSPSSSEADSDQDFDHIEVEDDEGTATSTTTTDAKTDPGLASPAKPQARSLSKSLKRNNNNKGRRKSRVVSSPLVMLTRSKDDRRVSLVSPNLTPTKPKRDTGRRHHR